MVKPKHTCFNCGTPTETSVQCRKIKRRRYICIAAACWKAYWKEQDDAS